MGEPQHLGSAGLMFGVSRKAQVKAETLEELKDSFQFASPSFGLRPEAATACEAMGNSRWFASAF
jgi:hypothetical protein